MLFIYDNYKLELECDEFGCCASISVTVELPFIHLYILEILEISFEFIWYCIMSVSMQ